MTGICCCIASRSQRLSGEFGSVPHELVIDDIITRVDLAMSLALIVIPIPARLAGETRFGLGSKLSLREDAMMRPLDRQSLG